MALRPQLGLGGFSAPRNQTEIKIQILDLNGDPLFGKGATYRGALWREALAHARYWLKRGHTRVRISNGKGERRIDFTNKLLIGWRG